LAPVARFVDDFFGVSVISGYWSGGHVLDRLLTLSGYTCDPKKSEDVSFLLKILEAEVTILVESSQVRWRIDPLKSQRWLDMLQKILDSRTLDPVLALRMAGRLGAALVMDKNKNGRAYIKPFFAQAYDPLPSISAHLQRACEWWINYLACYPEYIIDPRSSSRPTPRLWTHASGVSRWLCGVLQTSDGWYWTALQVP
jgi:hypothetical protein